MWGSRKIFLFCLITLLSSFYLTYLFSTGPSPFQIDLNSKMSSDTKLRVLLLGGSGAVGEELIKALADEETVYQVTLLLRKEVDISNITSSHKDKFIQKIIDFDNLNPQDFINFDVCMSSLGTTKRKSGAEGFYKVDHDYVINTAKLAKAGNCKHFNLVSSLGANKDSWFLYPQVKGQVEAELKDMGFSRTSIYRPAVLLTKRKESRPLEAIIQQVLMYVDCWRLASIEAFIVAKAIVKNSIHASENVFEILENKDILAIGR